MAPWTVSFGTRVLLVDGDEERLMRAVALLEKLVDADRANETGVHTDEGEAVSGKFPPRPRREGLPALELVPAVQFISAEELRGSSMLEGWNGAVDLVKVDIDSIDCEALRAVLHRVTPAVIVIETAAHLPPPFKYSMFRRDGAKSAYFGCSLSYQVRMLEPAFSLILYTGFDSVFVRSDLAPALEKLPPGRLFPWTSWTPRFPADEVDCFRRASSPRYVAGSRQLPCLQEWVLGEPADVFTEVWQSVAGAANGPFSLSF